MLLLFAGIGIGAVLFAIVLLVRGGDDTGSKPPALALVTNDAGSEGVRDDRVNQFATEELDASAAQPKADSREPRPTKVEEDPVEDIAKLDALAWLPEARKRAKALLPDPVAYIIRSYVTADGTTGGWSATYHFYSPRLIKRKDTKWCAARVQAGRHNVVVWPLKRCKTPARMPMPKCSGARLWQLAHEDGVEGERLELVWQVNEGVWRVQTRRGLQQTSFENDCTIKRLVPSLKDRGF